MVKAHTEVIEEHRPSAILEIASGFGDHILAYAREYPNISFQPTEYDNYLVAELTTKVQSAGLSNVQSPKKVDVSNSKLAGCPVARQPSTVTNPSVTVQSTTGRV